jgi:hypothetical protein
VLEIAPKDLQFRRNDRIEAEDAAPLEIRSQALEHDHVRRNQQKRFREVVASLGHRVEKLLRDGKGHHLRLPAACLQKSEQTGT